MRFTRPITACVAIGLTFFTAHAQFQVVHDVPNTSSSPQMTPLILADGSTVTHHWDAGEHIFRKYDSTGALVWSKAMAGPNWTSSSEEQFKLMSDGADGFRFVRMAEITNTPIDSLPFEDVITYSIQVGNVNGNGDMTSSFLVQKTSVLLSESPITGFDAARTPDNGMVLALTIGDLGGASIEMVKIAADGTLVWARSVGQLWSLDLPQPTFSFDLNPRATVAVSNSGGIYYQEGSLYFSNLRLAELDGNGDMLWMKHYVYANISPTATFHGLQVDAAGNVHAAGYINTSVGHFHIFLSTNASGALYRGDLYRTPFVLENGQFGIDAQGRRYHFVNTSMPNSQGILIADTLGTPAQFIRRDDQVVLPNNVFTLPKNMDVAGDRLAFSGLLNHVHVDLAYTTRYETVTCMETDAIAPCLMDDTTFADIPIPLDIMTTEDVPDAASIDVSAYYTSEPLALSFTSMDPDSLGPLCTFVDELLQIAQGVSESSPTAQTPLVVNSLVAQGTPVLLNNSKVLVVDVYDMYGALVQHATVDGNRNLSTAGWSTGMYILHAMDGRGRPLGTARIVLE